MSPFLLITIIVICSYFVGNINFAIIISKLKKSDIRKNGSGNPGTMNMIRSYGKGIGVLCLILDVLKGALPAFFGWWIYAGTIFDSTNMLGLYIAGISVVVGHIFPALLKFHGGKGIATIIGISLVANPIVTSIAFVAGLLFIGVFKLGAIGSFIKIFTPNIAQAIVIGDSQPESLALIFSFVALAIFAHRKNITRLFSGNENLTIFFKKKNKQI